MKRVVLFLRRFCFMFTIIDHENRKCIIFIIDEILKECWREERVSAFICKRNLWYSFTD
jgi:hypothetical protein